MASMKISTLIQALDTIGLIYRSDDRRQPAEAVQKLIQQLEGSEEMTLAEWVAVKAPAAALAQPTIAQDKIDEAISALEMARTQAALSARTAGLRLTPDEWRVLANQVTGWSPESVEEARELVEMHFSDRLLLEERIAFVRQQFDDPTPPPAGA
jgi:hypothetical protein